MNQTEFEDLVIGQILAVLSLNGIEPGALTADTVPFEEIAEFDSHNAFEVVANISEILGKEISPEIFGFSCDLKYPLKLTISEIAQNIKKI